MFKLEINLNNAAFEGDSERWEIGRILYFLSKKIADSDADDGALRDSNGNTVGKWSISEG